MNPYPWMSTTVARPCGECWRCGGTLYENLYHTCSTAVLGVSIPLPPPAPSEAGESKRQETET